MISHALIQIYVRNISIEGYSFARNFCQGHILNGDAKAGLLTLSDPRQHKNALFQF